MSQYIANLNALSPVDDVTNAQPEDFNDESLALFSNAFLDYDLSPTTQSRSLGYQAGALQKPVI